MITITAETPAGIEPPRKRRRVGRACDGCHKRGVKCAAAEREGTCQSCLDFGIPCTYDRPMKRRGPRRVSTSRQAVPESSFSHVDHAASPSIASSAGGVSGSLGDSGPSWYHDIASLETIQALLDCYHQIVYPIFPFFHWPSLSEKVKKEQYRTNRAFCASVMAACAIASARVRDGATLLPSTALQISLSQPTSEMFFAAAQAAIPGNLVDAHGFDYMRANALLAILCIQYDKIRLMHQFLGDYWTLVAMEGSYLESRWPSGIGIVEMEERRRLFWSIYTLEVYSSIVWGGIIRCRETQTQVSYPTEVDDEYITEAGISSAPQACYSACWLRGWNFTTDLYRVLEHAVDQLRTRRGVDGSVLSLWANGRQSPTPSTILEHVRALYDKLPNRFKETRAVASDPAEDRFSFQAANIIVTMQTLRMVVLGTEQASVEKACQVAGELLDALGTVPTAYLRAISSPLLHHLAGIGQILGGVVQGPLSQWSFLQVRNVLLAMADLLAVLESSLSFAAGTSERLKEHVRRIDQYMETAALERQEQQQVYHTPLPREVWPSTQAERRSSQNDPAALNWSPRSGGVSVGPIPFSGPDSTASVSTDAQSNGMDMFQFQLPDELLLDFPLDFGQGGAFNFLGDWFELDERAGGGIQANGAGVH